MLVEQVPCLVPLVLCKMQPVLSFEDFNLCLFVCLFVCLLACLLACLLFFDITMYRSCTPMDCSGFQRVSEHAVRSCKKTAVNKTTVKAVGSGVTSHETSIIIAKWWF